MKVQRALATITSVALLAGLGLIGGAAASNAAGPAAAPSGSGGPPQASGPQVTRAIHADTSPPLRSIPPASRGANHPVRERPDISPAGATTPRQDGALQTTTSSSVSAATTTPTGFAGVGAGDYGFSPNAAPPDTNGAVGATQYVQWVNESLAVFDKSSSHALVLGPEAGNTLWTGFGTGGAGANCATDNDGDPIVQYDKAANRWILTQFSVSTAPYLQCVAISTSSDATGTYKRYAFPMSNGFPDYPKLGIWSDGYYLTWNMFSGNFFVGAQLCSWDRNAMLAGSSTVLQICFQLSRSYGGVLPSDLDGSAAPPAGEPNAFVNFGANSLNVWLFHTDFVNTGNSSLSGPFNLPVATFSEACGGGTCIPQMQSSQQLDSLADRLMYRLAYRNFGDHESWVVNHSVAAGTSVGVRWYELRALESASRQVYQQGTYAPDSKFRWMGSIAMDQSGDVALGYSVSSGSMFPSIAYTGRVPSDALNTLEAENAVLSGGGSQQPNLSRWGDYSSMSIDPVDDCTFYYTTEYLKASGTFNWSTLIVPFKFTNCGQPATPDFSLSASPSTLTVPVGSTTPTSTITVSPQNGFSGTVNLTFAADASLNASLIPSSITGGSGSSTLAFKPTTPGTYPVTVTGTSGALSHQTSVTVTVPAPDNPPTATLTKNGCSGATCTFTATGSDVDTWAWSGASGSGSTATATYSSVGTFTVSVIGTDSDSGENTSSVSTSVTCTRNKHNGRVTCS